MDKGATFTGTIRVNGDYVSLKNLTITGNLEIGKEVENSFKANEITVLGKVNITDKASANPSHKSVLNSYSRNERTKFCFHELYHPICGSIEEQKSNQLK